MYVHECFGMVWPLQKEANEYGLHLPIPLPKTQREERTLAGSVLVLNPPEREKHQRAIFPDIQVAHFSRTFLFGKNSSTNTPAKRLFHIFFMFLCTTKHVQESFVERVSEHQDSAVYHMRIHLKSEFGSFSGSSCQPGKPLDFDECFTNLEARSHEMQNCRQS